MWHSLILLAFVSRIVPFLKLMLNSLVVLTILKFRCSDLDFLNDEDPSFLFPGDQYHVMSDSAFP
jgi:hypothetical protein